jgi:hypothetical protein
MKLQTDSLYTKKKIASEMRKQTIYSQLKLQQLILSMKQHSEQTLKMNLTAFDGTNNIG